MENNDILHLRKDLNDLKETVETLSILINKELIKELNEEVNNMESGEFLTKEEFQRKHNIKIQ